MKFPLVFTVFATVTFGKESDRPPTEAPSAILRPSRRAFHGIR
jgi:hypothetical protein